MKSRLALLVVDMQKGFMDESAYPGIGSSAKPVMKNFAKMIGAARESGIPVVYTVAIMGSYTAPLASRARKYARLAGQEDTAIVDELKPESKDFLVQKCRYNGFHGTELEILLRNLATETLLVGGVATEVCVESTVRGAIDRDFKVIVLEDCTASTDEQTKQTSLRNMKNMERGIEVRSSKDVLSELVVPLRRPRLRQ